MIATQHKVDRESATHRQAHIISPLLPLDRSENAGTSDAVPTSSQFPSKTSSPKSFTSHERFADASLNLAKDLVVKNEYQVEAGTLPKISLLQAKAAVAFRQVELIKAENEYESSIDNLKISMSMPLDEDLVVDGGIIKTDESLSDLDKVSQIAFNNRPEIKQSKLKTFWIKRNESNSKITTFTKQF